MKKQPIPKTDPLQCRKCGVDNHENHPTTGLFTAITQSTGHNFCSECLRIHGMEELMASLGGQTALFDEPVSGINDLPFD